MKRRLITSTLLIALGAVLVLGIPLGFAGANLMRDETLRQLDHEALTIGFAIDQQPDRAAHADTITALILPDRHAVVERADNAPVSIGAEIRDPITTQIHTTGGTTVTLSVSAHDLERRQAHVWAVVAVLSIVGLTITVALAWLQARRLTRPLTALAATSRRFGDGDLTARAEPSGIAEIDTVADALNQAAVRIAATVDAERRFSAEASHQLRTPLTALSLRLEEIRDTADLDLAHNEADRALEQTDRLAATVTRLLEFRRHGTAGDRHDFDLDHLIAEHIRHWGPLFDNAHRTLRYDGQPSRRYGSPHTVSQALDVVLDNALHHGAGPTTVTLTNDERAVRIAVTDHGPGVPPATAQNLFTTQPDQSDGHGHGHGIGLALARALLESDGGRLQLLATQPTTFEIILDRRPHSSEVPSRPGLPAS